MTTHTYLSVFSGIGGLEHPTVRPLLFCEHDKACQHVLRAEHPEIAIVSDIRLLHAPPAADVVVGGWPCQDISNAGTRGGIRARRSGLFFEMLRVARAAGAHTLVGENVPNLLTINGGADFRLVLDALLAEGYTHIGWRVLNARQFGLPQQRRRLFIVASRFQQYAEAIHAHVMPCVPQKTTRDVFAFYWTGGKRSICLSHGYAPALKIGATDNKGRAPVAVLVDGRIRKLSSQECLRLQGFELLEVQRSGLSRSTLLRMAGNAVPRPMGRFVVESIFQVAGSDGMRTSFGIIAESGIQEDGILWQVSHARSQLASNLSDFLDSDSTEYLSSQAAAGLLVRSVRSGQPMPVELCDLLENLATKRDGALRPSRANSFDALEGLREELVDYRKRLAPLADFVRHDEADSEDASHLVPREMLGTP